MGLKVIYLIGVIFFYYLRREYKKEQGEWSWGQFGLTLFLSLFSWFVFIGIAIIRNIKISKRPPKWL